MLLASRAVAEARRGALAAGLALGPRRRRPGPALALGLALARVAVVVVVVAAALGAALGRRLAPGLGHQQLLLCRRGLLLVRARRRRGGDRQRGLEQRRGLRRRRDVHDCGRRQRHRDRDERQGGILVLRRRFSCSDRPRGEGLLLVGLHPLLPDLTLLEWLLGPRLRGRVLHHRLRRRLLLVLLFLVVFGRGRARRGGGAGRARVAGVH